MERAEASEVQLAQAQQELKALKQVATARAAAEGAGASAVMSAAQVGHAQCCTLGLNVVFALFWNVHHHFQTVSYQVVHMPQFLIASTILTMYHAFVRAGLRLSLFSFQGAAESVAKAVTIAKPVVALRTSADVKSVQNCSREATSVSQQGGMP